VIAQSRFLLRRRPTGWSEATLLVSPPVLIASTDDSWRILDADGLLLLSWVIRPDTAIVPQKTRMPMETAEAPFGLPKQSSKRKTSATLGWAFP
jgi:hypothetical protein